MNVQIEAANTTELLAKYADELAAMLDQMLDTGRVPAARLRDVRDSLGEIHVELDQLTTDLREDVRAEVAKGVQQIAYVPLIGTAA